jgi:hypothetical protein
MWLVIDGWDPSYFLYRYTGSGEFAGDTWRGSLGDAQHQADYEYACSSGGWMEVTSDIDDPVELARQRFAQIG